jgi:hypothetical protein
LTGSGGVKISIRLTPQRPEQNPNIIPMDHYPSWKFHKNPFWRVKHPNGSKLQAVTPVVNAQGELEAKEPIFAYEASQDIGGIVTIQCIPGKKTEHMGIKIQFIGRIDMVRGFYKRAGVDFVAFPLVTQSLSSLFYYCFRCVNRDTVFMKVDLITISFLFLKS